MFRQDLYPDRYKTFGLIMLRIGEINVETYCYNKRGRTLGSTYYSKIPMVLKGVE